MSQKHNIPKPLKTPRMDLDYNAFGEASMNASQCLGFLEGLCRDLPSTKFLLWVLATKEATVSSRMEGTKSTVSDVYQFKAGGKAIPDTRLVDNHREVIFSAMKAMREKAELTNHFIRGTHKVLLDGTEYNGTLGEFRNDIVWVGEKDGDPIEKATYIPPEHFHVQGCMDNLISYVKHSHDFPLIKAGIAHYQFEAIHPFVDGNGRIGRLLIPLILYRDNQLSTQIFYISGYFSKNRSNYTDALRRTDKTGKYEEWLIFFLESMANQALDTAEMIIKIDDLYSAMKKYFKGRKRQYLGQFIDFLFRTPIFTVQQVQREIKCSSRITVDKLIQLFIRENFLMDINQRSGHAKLYAFLSLIKILN